MNNQFHEYNKDEFYTLPWANDFMNADPKSSEFSNAMAEADKYYGPEWTNKQLEAWGIEFENAIENGKITPDQLPENSAIQQEAEQLTDNNPHNDEVRNDAVSATMRDELNNRLESSDIGIAKDKDWSTTYRDNPSFQDMIYARAQDGDWLAKRYMNALDRAKGGSFNDREKLKSWEKKLFKNIENNPEWKDYWDKSMSSEDAPTYDQLFGNKISDIKDLPLTDEEYAKLSEELTEKPIRNVIPGTEPDPLGLNISNEERANWNGGEDRAVSDATISEMDNALASRTRPVKPGSEMLDRAQPIGLLGKYLNASKLERITEENPELIQEVLPNTPIANEAAQITEDDDKRNDEVNNQAAEETIGMGWNNGLVHDDYDPRIEANNEYEYPENVGDPGVLTGRDEDFAGPDELPATIDQIRDEDFVGPDEQLVPSGNRDLVPPPPPPPTDNYSHDFDYNIEEIDRQPGIPEEPEIQTKITDVNDMGLLRAKPISVGGSSVPSVPQAPLASAETHTGGNSIGTKGILPRGSLGYSAPYMGSASTPKASSYNGSGKVGTIGKADVNTDASVVTGKQSESSGFVTNNGGNLDSGATNFRSSLGHIQPAKLPSEVEEHTNPAVNGLLGSGASNIREALISRLNMLLDKIDKETLRKLGFSPSDHNYKGTPLKNLDGATLRELVDMVESSIE